MKMKGTTMRLRSPLERGLRVCIPTFVALLAWTAAVADAPMGDRMNRLTRLDIQETDAATRIVVEGSAPPTFTVYKLTEPARLFIDVSNAVVEGLEDPVEVENGVVTTVSVMQFTDELVSVGRIVVGLEIDALYTVEAEDDRVVVSVDASQRAIRSPAVSSVRERELEARAEAAERRAREAEDAHLRAERSRLRAEAELRALESERQESLARIRDLEQVRGELADQLTVAHAEKDATLAARLEAEQRLRETELAAEMALVAHLESGKQMSELSKRIETLQGALADARANDRSSEADSLGTVVAGLEAEKAELESALRSKEAEARRANELAAAERAAADDRAAALRSAEDRAEAAEAARRKAETELARLASEREQALGRILELESVSGQLDRQLDEARSDNDAALARQLELEQRARAAEVAAERARVAQLDSASQVSEMAERQRDLRDQLAKARADDQADRVAALQREVDGLQEQQADFQAALDGKARDARVAREEAAAAVARAERATGAATARAEAAEARAGEAEAARRRAETELANIERQRQLALGRIDGLEKAAAEMSIQLDGARADRNAALTARLEADHRAQVAELRAEQTQVAQLESAKQVSAMRSRLDGLEGQLAEATRSDRPDDVVRLRTERDRLAAEESRLVAALRDNERETLEARAAAAAARNDAAESTSRMAARAEAAEARARAAEGRAAALEADRQSAIARAAALEASQNELAEQLAEARAANDESRTKAIEAQQSAREAEIRAERAELARLESAQQVSALNQTLSGAQAELDAARRAERADEVERLRTEVGRLETQSKKLELALSERTDEAHSARAIADAATASIALAHAAVDAAEAKAEAADAARRRAEAELARLAVERQASEERIDALEATQSKLSTDLDAARRAKNAARTARLIAEQRAGEAEIDAEKARIVQLRTVEQTSNLARRIAELEGQVTAARHADRTDEVERLRGDVARLTSESAAKSTELVAKARALAEARRQATEARAAADALPTGETALQPEAVAKVTDVRFQDLPDATFITVVVEGEVRYDLRTEGQRSRILELRETRIAPALERTLDTGDFASAVQLVSSFQAPPPGESVRIVVTLAEKVADRVERLGNRLVWRFEKPASARRTARPVATLPPPPAWTPPGSSAPSREVPYQVPRAAAYDGRSGSGDSGRRRGSRNRNGGPRYTGRKISIDIKNADIHNILRLLAKEGSVNIITSDDVKGDVTLHLKLVPWDQVLDIVLRSKGLAAVREGNIVRVAPQELIAAEREAELKAAELATKLKELQVKLITVNHAVAENLIPRVRSVLSERGAVEFDARTNTVIVKDIDDHLDAAEDLVRRLDTQTPQVLIESRIVEVNSVDEYQLGIQWGGDATASAATGNPTGLRFPSVIGVSGGADDPQAPVEGTSTNPNYVVNLPAQAGTGSGGVLGMTLGSVGGAMNLNLRLSALENRGSVKIISSPKITTLDNEEAVISQGVSIPISQVSANGVSTVFFDAVLRLTVKPHVTQDGNIYIDLKAENNTPDFQNVGARGDPTILKKEARTQLLLKDGDTTVIGGIYTSNAGYSESEVPFFARIPVLGALFRTYRESDRRTELLIFVTPRIVNRAAASVRTNQ